MYMFFIYFLLSLKPGYHPPQKTLVNILILIN